MPGYVFDLVVIGTGPAGLAAAVYGASEGLDTVSLDAVGTGGQAGASSRIENYVGFPNGISGEDLVVRAAIQAQRLGARLSSPCEVAGLRTDSTFHAVVLADGSEIPCRTVIVASGARYQRLAVADLERFEGAGVYYAATDLEARICTGSDVIVIGGGNSAGQAALYLAQQGSGVSIAIRGSDLAKSMSAYLIERIAADPRIQVLTNTEVRALEGAAHLERVTVEFTPTGESRTLPCIGLFCFIGADPSTEWLEGVVALDASGFRPDGSITSRRRARHDVRHARSAAVRDVGTRRLRRGRRAPCLAQARRGGGGRGIERGPIGARSPRHDLARATDALGAHEQRDAEQHRDRTDDGPHRLVRHERAVQRSDALEDPHDPDDDQERSDDEPCPHAPDRNAAGRARVGGGSRSGRGRGAGAARCVGDACLGTALRLARGTEHLAHERRSQQRARRSDQVLHEDQLRVDLG